ncbi:uncharacterized protein LOC111370258 [Olea europaea var. sylvestris]|uniref:uncharacterized protein LOC111370258 n=1 Tax=Olea europaea var. sylvestris TaxID=158386 RepID=UPI000C1D1B42|nr:uncharacterized protein LOC111370258 [Olea europaea var. sylvestris]
MERSIEYLEGQKLYLQQIQGNLNAEYWRVQGEPVGPITITRLAALEQQMADNSQRIRATEDQIIQLQIQHAEGKVQGLRVQNAWLKNQVSYRLSLQEGQGSNVVEENESSARSGRARRS